MVILVPISPFAGELVVFFSWRGVDCRFSSSLEAAGHVSSQTIHEWLSHFHKILIR